MVEPTPDTLITMEEVRKHMTPDDCWIVVDGKVYDLTNFAAVHPGGPNVVHSVAGFDATEPFHAMHGNGKSFRKAKLMMTQFCIGHIQEDAFSNINYTVGQEKDSTCTTTGFDLAAARAKASAQEMTRDDVDEKESVSASTSGRSADHTSTTEGADSSGRSSSHHNYDHDQSSSSASSSTSPPAQVQQQPHDKELHDMSAGDRAFRQLREDITNDPDLWHAKWKDTVAHSARMIPFFIGLVAIIYQIKDVPLEDYTAAAWGSVLLAAFCLGMVWHQSAFVAHDACHRGTPEEHGSWHWFGSIYGSCFFGISAAMWGDDHYVHHTAVRRPHGDPQFEYYPICLLSLKELDADHPINFFVRILLRVQHIIFLPLALLVGRMNLHVISIFHCIKYCAKYYLLPTRFGGVPRPAIFRPEMDLLGMAFYWCCQLYVISLLPGTYPKLAFFLISNWTCSVLHIQLLVSHIGVESFTHEEQMSNSWFSHQVLTSRNVSTSWWDGWLWGGLEYQIEHHLFPRLPRESLHKVAPRVKALCEKFNLPYRTHGTCDVIGDVVNDFHAVATLALEIPG